MSPILLSLLVSLGINMLVFLIAYKFQVDKLTDITYTLTFILLTSVFWYTGTDKGHYYKLILCLMPILWGLRLGIYLMYRIMKIGRDKRFDKMRQHFFQFGRFFLLQGLSIWIIILPAIIGLSAKTAAIEMASNSALPCIGFGIWCLGFFLESVADIQKFNFRMNPKNQGKYMDKGLFSVLRFPNYTGEILVWTGVFIFVIPVLQNLEWLSIISPIWITVLLVFISGIPFLERSNAHRYGHLEEFKQYQSSTKKLIPFLF